MIVRKAYKFKLKTSSREKKYFSQIAGCVRLVWNKSLAIQKDNCDHINREFLKLGGKAASKEDAKKLKSFLYRRHFLSGFEITTNLLVPLWKRSEELAFLNECPAQSLQKPIANLDIAFKKAFTKQGGFPKFKKKGQRDSIYFPQGFKVKDNKVFLPKIGWIKFFKSRDIKGTVKNVTVTSDSMSNWFASFCTEEEKVLSERHEGEVGLDLGITTFVATSCRDLIKKPDKIKKLTAMKKRVARALSRKKKGGNNRKKASLVLKKAETKITNIRKDFLHKTSTTLSKNHAMIAVEKLKIKNMSKSARGTMEEPGRHVRAKSGLNREILGSGWGMFKEMLKYKQLYSGGRFVEVNPVNTSRKCNACGQIDKASRVRQNWYACTNCGHEIHADTNAAINILAAGRVVIACGETRLHQ